MPKTILSLLAALILVGGAHAQSAPGAPPPGDTAAQHRQFCQDTYAHAVGDLAYLEARLSLTHQQQSLFDRWKNERLIIAQHSAADCATRELPRSQGKPPTALDAMTRERENLKHRLAELDAEMPVFDAFYRTLSQPQKDALDHPGPVLLTHRFGFNGAMNGRDRGPGGPPNSPPPSQ